MFQRLIPLGFWFLYFLAQFINIWLLFSAFKAAKDKELKEKLHGLQDWGLPPLNPIPNTSYD